MHSLLLIDVARTISHEKHGSSDPIARAGLNHTPRRGRRAWTWWLVSVALATAGGMCQSERGER